ncbi:membrane lipoprotein lipid attachment site-containing protein [Peribacillus butanolivorans]|uniref:membrane lipoprotein lipid attachment site-containing protein n=1 Tax=Peribacillus butanolivorans TaxID=421767 RepID=UPI003D2B19AD
MKKTLFILLIVYLVILTGCNQESTDTGSSAVIVIVNNKEYNGTEDKLDKSKELGEEIGTVEKKTKPDEMPKENQSNYFEVGSKIYSVKGTEDYIIVVDNNNEKELLKKVTKEG